MWNKARKQKTMDPHVCHIQDDFYLQSQRREEHRLLLPLTFFLLKILRLSQVWWLARGWGVWGQPWVTQDPSSRTNITKGEIHFCHVCVLLFALLDDSCRHAASPKAQGNLALQHLQFSQVMTEHLSARLSNINSHHYIFNKIKNQPNLNKKRWFN